MAETTAVALLFDDDELGVHLREALQEHGARIVHEGGLAGLSLELMQRLDADVVVINLDDQVDEVLDRLDDVIQGDRPRIVFNEAQSSRSLDGWARARWARHLAAKVLAQGDVDPPRPPAPAIEEQQLAPAASVPPHGLLASADDAVADVVARTHESEIAAESESLEAELEALLSGDPLPGTTDEGAAELLYADPLPAAAGSLADAGDLHSNGVNNDDNLELDDFELDELALGDLDFGSEAPLYDGDFLDNAGGSEADLPAVDVSLADDTFGDADDRADIATVGLELLDDEPVPTSEPVPGTAVPASSTGAAAATAPRVSDAWSLVDDDQPPAAIVRPSASDFGVEKLSATDYLAPEADSAEPTSEPFMTLELVSLEEAMAPKPYESGRPSEMFLEELSGGLSRVVLVGATTDSRASVREFLTRLPAGMRATIVLTQHLGGRPVEELVQELAGHCALSVRVAASEQPARPGELLVVPPEHHVRVLRDGTVELKASQDVPASSPSIDASFTAVANIFGIDALAILFAGRANDAMAGCQAVHDRGGRVWVEDAPGEHFADMVSGVMAERLADFSGTAAELAARLIEEY
ncbi:chemotaxis protein CheB [Dyella sp.]|jgi:two-component system chemotaxis response regulator CheB/chemosensory pili system protein ChpB (putative protein-glutamate methylesterase)|uniref:chemotaxis protein CheB n=1 Tax=Dyella sp. TaxID=1869338 RepID=UPI002D772CB0|nr:chemotaxis protein CheB [Dyella sp.]HET6433257.1 chemotaxis protein CheB [Dyella sp.]